MSEDGVDPSLQREEAILEAKVVVALALAAVAAICVLYFLRLNGLITLMVSGGAGYAIGATASPGWGVYGAVFGLLVGLSFFLNRRGKRRSSDVDQRG